MPKTFIKNIFCEIRNSFGRFVSILSIVAIGVAFFAGVKASAPDMKYSADTYFDQQNLQDIQIFSSLGLTEEDLQAVSQIEGVDKAQGVFTMDALTQKDKSQIVVQVFSLPEEQNVNTIRLVKGRMPENENECLVEAESVNTQLLGGLTIGDTITLTSGTDEEIKDTLKNDTYTIVGMCYTPTYLSYEKGSSDIGSGTVDTFIFVPDSNVLVDYYTEIDVLVSGAQALNSYEGGYFDVIDPVLQRIEDIADGQIEIRIRESQTKVDDAQRDLDTQIADAQAEINDGQRQIHEGQSEIVQSEQTLADSRAQLDAGWQEYYDGMAQLEVLDTINDAIAQIEEQEQNRDALVSGIEQCQAQIDTINETLATLEAVKQSIPQDVLTLLSQEETLRENRAQAAALLEQLNTDPEQNAAQIEAVQAQLDTIDKNLAMIEAIKQNIPQEVLQLLSQEETLRAGLVQAQSALDELNENLAQLDAAIAQKQELIAQRDLLLDAKAQLDAAYAELIDGEQQYQSGLAQLQSAKADLVEAQAEVNDGQVQLDRERADAQAEIDDAQKQVDDLEGEWYVLDRNSHYSYRDYGACADRMDGIAAVFPVFFFMVAALVCMTTMTRMVDEQRNEIGTLKALGYSKAQIAGKYLAYALIAGIIGSLIGCLVGMIIFPYVIFYAWNTLYNLETIYFESQPMLVILSSVSMTGITLLATLYSIYSELMEVPSQLMRPKAAQAGKKILLERVKPVWNRLSFLQKVTARNIFRYKKRFFMTIVGIAGCSALLVAGFGINDSISTIAHEQYEAIYHYNATIGADAISEELTDSIRKLDGVTDVSDEEQISLTVDYEDEDHTVTTHIIDDIDEFETFTTLAATDGDPIDMRSQEAVISAKLASNMGLDIGDTITLQDSDDQSYSLKITGFFENYVGHHLYITKETFDSWEHHPDTGVIYMIRTDDQSDAYEDDLGNELMALDGVNSVTFYSSLQQNFTDMIASISIIVVVLVISAAALAFVVLYNLSNVNISERVREIATIKVLGFTKKEVNQYVNRESILLAMLGAVVGLVIGIGLHHLIMNLAEMDDVMFGRTIRPVSFLISFAGTMLFTFIVNFFMSFKLKKIQMVESLKAVE